MGQLLLAGLSGGLLLLVTSPQTSSTPIMAQVMVAMSLLQLPLALSLAYTSAKGGTKSSALSAVIVLGVLLSSPAWFALFAFLTGATARYLLIMMLLLMTYYLLGFIFSGLFIKQAMTPDEEKEDREKGTVERLEASTSSREGT